MTEYNWFIYINLLSIYIYSNYDLFFLKDEKLSLLIEKSYIYIQFKQNTTLHINQINSICLSLFIYNYLLLLSSFDNIEYIDNINYIDYIDYIEYINNID